MTVHDGACSVTRRAFDSAWAKATAELWHVAELRHV
jgi:hypothetical protein